MIRALISRLLTSYELWRADKFARDAANIDGVCMAERCTISQYHAPCFFQSAIANKRDAKRRLKAAK